MDVRTKRSVPRFAAVSQQLSRHLGLLIAQQAIAAARTVSLVALSDSILKNHNQTDGWFVSLDVIVAMSSSIFCRREIGYSLIRFADIVRDPKGDLRHRQRTPSRNGSGK